MDTALLFGAIALLGIFAFGFLYIGTGDDSDGYDAVKRADLKLKEKKPKDSKKKKEKNRK